MLKTFILSLAGLLSCCLALPTNSAALTERAAGYISPRLVQYCQTFHTPSGQPLSLRPLLNQKTGVTHVNLAAIHINGPGDIHLNDINPNDTYWNSLWSDIKVLQKGGIKVLFMIGGAAQGSYAKLCGTSVPAVISEANYGPLLSAIKYHHIDGVDLDIEESVDISCPLALLRRLNNDLGENFLLTMAPVASALMPGGPGLSGFDYVVLDSQATDSNRPNGKLVNWYNAQFYNGWGNAGSASGLFTYESQVSLGGWSASRISLGALDSPRDGGSGFVPLSQLERVIIQLRAKYSPFGGVAGWEYWDAGKQDGNTYPWQWDTSVDKAEINGVMSKSKRFVPTGDETTDPPFPGVYALLRNAGATHLGAVYALNRTGGDLQRAAAQLNLTLPFLSKFLSEEDTH